MELNNEFVVAVPIDEAWAVLTDVEKIAPCMPGAELKEVEGDEYRGIVKVKVGPITTSYRGVASFLELDATSHRAVLKAEGRETRGQGNATATITATLVPVGEGTKVDVATDLAITGKVAQFGRGVLAEVSGKLLDQFVRNLETTVLSPDGAPAGKGAHESELEAAAAAAAATAQAAPGGAGGDGSGAGGDGGKTGARRAGGRKTAGSAEGAAAGAAEGAAAEAATSSESAAPEAPAAPSGPRRIDSAPAEPVNLVEVAGASLGKRLLPFASIAGVLVLVRIIVYALRRRKR